MFEFVYIVENYVFYKNVKILKNADKYWNDRQF